jgi:hypothetical protein
MDSYRRMLAATLRFLPCNAKAQFTRCHYTRRGIHAVRLH